MVLNYFRTYSHSTDPAMRFSFPLFGALFGMAFMAAPVRVYAQFGLPDDTVLCGGLNHFIPSGFKSVSSSTAITLTDDQFSGVINIGFPFTFYGQTYTQCVISSNNYITFDLTTAGGFSPWAINADIPNTTNAQENSIMCPWQDINPGVGGVVEYGIAGTAPNRVFTVSFCEIPMFSCTTIDFTNQILLYEGSNRIETHIRDKPLCATWNGGVAIHGLQNATGTVANVVPGRNFSDPTWVTVNEGYAFIPNSSGPAYTIQPIPFDPSVFNPIVWQNSAGVTIHTGDSLPITLPQGSVETYTVETSICGGAVLADTITVYIPTVEAIPLEPSCQGEATGVVYIDLFDQNPYRYNIFLIDATDSIVWANGIQRNEDTARGVPPGILTLVVVDTNGCELYDTLVVGALPAISAGIMNPADTLWDSVLVVQEFINLSAGADSFYWTANGQTSTDTNAIFTFDTCGVYPVTLVSVNEFGCSDSTALFYWVYCYVPDPPIPIPDSSFIEFPNVFTPNGDGENDYFNAVYDGYEAIETFQGQVFNRFGALMYEWTDVTDPVSGWDGTYKGKEAAEGVYMLVISAKGTDGVEHRIQRTLTLSRN